MSMSILRFSQILTLMHVASPSLPRMDGGQEREMIWVEERRKDGGGGIEEKGGSQEDVGGRKKDEAWVR